MNPDPWMMHASRVQTSLCQAVDRDLGYSSSELKASPRQVCIQSLATSLMHPECDQLHRQVLATQLDGQNLKTMLEVSPVGTLVTPHSLEIQMHHWHLVTAL